MEMGTIEREGVILFSAGGEKKTKKKEEAYSGLKQRDEDENF